MRLGLAAAALGLAFAAVEDRTVENVPGPTKKKAPRKRKPAAKKTT